MVMTREIQRGQALVEAALVIPTITLMTFFIIQFGWVLYTGSCLSYACSHAQYVVTEAEAEATSDYEALVRSKLLEASPILGSGTLMVEDAHVKIEPTQVESHQLSDQDFLEYTIGSKNEKTTRMSVTANVTYQPVMLFGITAPVKYVRHIDGSKITSELFELA